VVPKEVTNKVKFIYKVVEVVLVQVITTVPTFEFLT